MDPRYQTPATPVVDHDPDGEFRNLTRHTTVLAWMLRVGAVLALFSLVSSWLQLDLLSREFTGEEGSANDRREAMIGGLTGLLSIAIMVVFGRWIVLAHRNLPALGARYLEYRPGWAVGWFFVPFANLGKPYLAMRSLWRNSRDAQRPESQESTWLLPTWWAFWLASSLLGNSTFRMQMHAHSREELVQLTQISLFWCLISAILHVLASLLVTRIWQAQEHQYAHPVEAPKGFADAPA